MKIKLVFAFIIAVVFACSGGGEKAEGTKVSSTAPQQDEALAKGKKTYSQFCVACHGADGKLAINGAKDFAESVLKLEERVEVISNGQGMMTPFKGILKPEQIEQVAKYTIHLGKQGKE